MKKVLRLSSLVVMLFALVALCACAPKDGEKAKAKLKKAEYGVVVDDTYIPLALKSAGVKEFETVLIATNGEESVTAILFASAGAAKDAKGAIANYAKKNGGKSEVKVAGKWIYYGTEKGMKAFN